MAFKATAEQIDYYRDEVCSRCPGSLWGQKSICRVHQISIGQIERCPQWDSKENGIARGPTAPERGTGLEQASRSRAKSGKLEQVEEELKDYPWMLREIDRLRGLLEEAGAGLTRAYGIEEAMPKGKGRHADAVGREAQNREKHWSRLKLLEAKVARFDEAADRIRDERLRTVLECLMEGRRMNRIAEHIGVSRQRLHELKRELIRLLAEAMYGGEG